MLNNMNLHELQKFSKNFGIIPYLISSEDQFHNFKEVLRSKVVGLEKDQGLNFEEFGKMLARMALYG